MSKATSQAFSSYRRNRTVLIFRERYRLTVFVSNGTVAVMAQRGISLKSVLTCYEKNKMIFFFIWAVIDFLTINISWFLLNIKQHPSPISRKPQTVLNVWMAWIVCIVLFSYHKCACPMSRAIASTFWPSGRGPNVKNIWPWKSKINVIAQLYRLTSLLLHENQTSNSWHTLFQNLTLKIQGQGHGWGKMSRSHNQPSIHSMYRQVSNIRRTKSQHLKDSRTVLRLSLPNPLLGWERRCSWNSADRRCSNYI